MTSEAPKTRNAAKPQHAERRAARGMAVQGLYQWLLTQHSAEAIQAHLHSWSWNEDSFSDRADAPHLDALVSGCIAQAQQLDDDITPHLDRNIKELSPVEHAILMIAAYEMKNCIDIPVKVVINEAVELCKSYGGTDGHKFVNGVLDKLAPQLRSIEMESLRQRRSRT